MNKVNQLWQDERDKIALDYCHGSITLKDAITCMQTLGYDRFDAQDYLTDESTHWQLLYRTK